jgi:hypothetical protein
MTLPVAVSVAVVFVWLGMVLAISFLEAPLKFRAPNVTLAIGLGIGRVVFRALNAVEVVFAIVIVAAIIARPASVCVTDGDVGGRDRGPGRADRRGSAPVDPPLRPGAGRTRRTAFAWALRLRRPRADQGAGLGRGRILLLSN